MTNVDEKLETAQRHLLAAARAVVEHVGRYTLDRNAGLASASVDGVLLRRLRVAQEAADPSTTDSARVTLLEYLGGPNSTGASPEFKPNATMRRDVPGLFHMNHEGELPRLFAKGDRVQVLSWPTEEWEDVNVMRADGCRFTVRQSFIDRDGSTDGQG